MAHLKSFGNPYLSPVVGADLNHYQDERDVLWRMPLRYLRKRPIYANEKERTKLEFKTEEMGNVCDK